MAYMTIPVIPCSKNLIYMPEKMYPPWEQYNFTFDLPENDYTLSLDLVDVETNRNPSPYRMTVSYEDGDATMIEPILWADFKEVGTDTAYGSIPTPKNARVYQVLHGKIVGLHLQFTDVRSGHIEKVMLERGNIPTEWEQAEEPTQ